MCEVTAFSTARAPCVVWGNEVDIQKPHNYLLGMTLALVPGVLFVTVTDVRMLTAQPCAGQSRLGNCLSSLFRHSRQKEGSSMVKNTRFTSGAHQSAALVVLGWLCFIAGVLLPEHAAKLPLLAIARVLP